MAPVARVASAFPHERGQLRTSLSMACLKPQEKPYSCGAASLANALRWLGMDVSEEDVRREAQTNIWRGTSEDNLRNAARHYGFDVEIGDFRMKLRRASALRWVARHTAQGHLALACVDHYDHWVLVMAVIGDRVVVVDPANDVEVVTDVTRRYFARRWWSVQGGEASYYAMALVPRTQEARRLVRRHLPVTRAVVRRLRTNGHRFEPNLLRDDLTDVFGAPSRNAGDAEPAHRFIARHRRFLLERAAHWHAFSDRRRLAAKLRDLEAAAEAGGFVVRRGVAVRALAELAMLAVMLEVEASSARIHGGRAATSSR